MGISTENLSKGLSHLLKSTREKRGLTQKEFASLLEISYSNLQKLEMVTRVDFPISLLAKLANVLETDLESIFSELLAYSGEAKEEGELKKKLSYLLVHLSKDNLESLIKPEEEDGVFKKGWNLEMAANMANLPAKDKAEIGATILNKLVDRGILKKEKVKKQIQDLYSYVVFSD